MSIKKKRMEEGSQLERSVPSIIIPALERSKTKKGGRIRCRK